MPTAAFRSALAVAMLSFAVGCQDEPVSTDICGDGITRGDEVCDDGVNDGTGPNACLPDCAAPATCGDGAITAPEVCDDGPDNGTGEGACLAGCTTVQVCGDGAPNGTEVCDQGDNLGGEGRCLPGCASTQQCGDGVTEGTESCDDGAANGSGPTFCLASCSGVAPSVCGDGLLTGDETCDDGVNDGAEGECVSGCGAVQICGDGNVVGTEYCDDGAANHSGDDWEIGQCTADCLATVGTFSIGYRGRATINPERTNYVGVEDLYVRNDQTGRDWCSQSWDADSYTSPEGFDCPGCTWAFSIAVEPTTTVGDCQTFGVDAAASYQFAYGLRTELGVDIMLETGSQGTEWNTWVTSTQDDGELTWNASTGELIYDGNFGPNFWEPPCADRCTGVHEAQCVADSDVVETCVLSDDGCYEWAATDCAAAGDHCDDVRGYAACIPIPVMGLEPLPTCETTPSTGTSTPGTLECGGSDSLFIGDLYEVNATAGDCVTLRADNPGSPGNDLLIYAFDANGNWSRLDDDFACAVSNPDGFACPEGAPIASASGPFQVWVTQWNGTACTAGASDPYTLEVIIGGVVQTPVLLRDDYLWVDFGRWIAE